MSLVGSVLSEESVLSPELFPGPQFSDFSSSFSVSSVSFSLSFTLTVSVVSSVEAVSSFSALSSVWEADVSGTEAVLPFGCFLSVFQKSRFQKNSCRKSWRELLFLLHTGRFPQKYARLSFLLPRTGCTVYFLHRGSDEAELHCSPGLWELHSPSSQPAWFPVKRGKPAVSAI